MNAIRDAAHIEVYGIVQGVGFRPFVHRLALELGLVGSVRNDSSRVSIDVVGPAPAVEEFVRRLDDDAPPLARVDRIVRTAGADTATTGFSIVESRPAGGARTFVPPDVAVCDDCLRELLDPDDRRYRHPFITCTNCGPRFTIIRALPYDRPNTTMSVFPMCDRCAVEYRDPTDRRFHAQPVACHDCGPTLTFVDTDGRHRGEHAVAAAVALIRESRVVAVKGLGGFHLACDATDDDAIATLRFRKHRPDKPFAVMVADLDTACELAHLDDREAEQLRDPARPIVLLRARGERRVSGLVAPGNPMLGVMLPYTPLQHLLFDAGIPPLVMTSANRGGDPIVFRDEDMAAHLDLCDGVLGHDRAIEVPCDDSVVRVVDGRLLPIRRARGFAPIPIPFPGARRAVLAVGAELKNTFTVVSDGHAWVSQHIGDMENLATLRAFDAAVAQYSTMYAVRPEAVAVDEHPGYLSSGWARRNRPEPVMAVQHHHAHVAAVMAEHRLDPAEPVIGLAFDGTGYGADGAIWGGEVLVADATSFERRAHLRYVPLPGGDAAIANPYRVALAHLHAAGIDWNPALPSVAALADGEGRLLRRQLTRGVACVPTSSMGRLFDAVASLLGLRHQISYEAQAAIDLEHAAQRATAGRHYRFEMDADAATIGVAGLLAGITADVLGGAETADIALGFHEAVAELTVEASLAIRAGGGPGIVVLSGGVFQNALLGRMCVRRLDEVGFDVRTHRIVPPNDGGLSLGQAFVAAHRPDVERQAADRPPIGGAGG